MSKDSEAELTCGFGDLNEEELDNLALLSKLSAAGNQQLKTRESDGKQFISVDWLAVVDVVRQLISDRERAARRDELLRLLMISGVNIEVDEYGKDRIAELTPKDKSGDGDE